MESFQGRMSGDLLVGGQHHPGGVHPPGPDRPLQGEVPGHRHHPADRRQPGGHQWVLEGRAEVGVVGARSGHRAIEYRELMPDDIVLIVGAAHPWQGRPLVTLEELRAEPLLLREQGSGTRAALERAWSPRAPTSARSGSSARWARPRRSSRRSRPGSGCRWCRGGRSRRSAARAALVPARRRPHDHPRLLPRHASGAQSLAPRGGLPGLRRDRGQLTPRSRWFFPRWIPT